MDEPEDPLLVSVQSGAAVSMPGMMDTVLNLGLNGTAVERLARRTGDERCARDSYRRFSQMFGDIVLKIDPDKFEAALDDLKKVRGVEEDTCLGAEDLESLIDTYKEIVGEEANRPFQAHPWNIDEATWFVLTAEPPWVRPVKAKIEHSTILGSSAHYTTISLTVQPWVPSETVQSAYRQVQRRVIGGDSGRIGEKNLNLLRFVAERADAAGNLPTGRTLVREWDKRWKDERPQWCYGADTRTFWRDFRSVQKSVANSSRAGLVLEKE
jgi:hypothetical protein